MNVIVLVQGYAPHCQEQPYSDIQTPVAAGVERIVYSSSLSAAPLATFTHAREHYLTEQRIRESGCRYTFLRPTLYLDRAPRWFSSEGVVQGPAGNGTITWVSRDDLADVAVAVLTDNGHDGASYEITGSHALTLTQAAEEFSRATGIPTSYHPESIEEAKASRAKFNPTDWELEAWVSTYVAIATGEMSVVSHTVEALTGHAPQTLADYLHRHPESYEHITPTRL